MNHCLKLLRCGRHSSPATSKALPPSAIAQHLKLLLLLLLFYYYVAARLGLARKADTVKIIQILYGVM